MMMMSHVYSITPGRLAERYEAIVQECRRQGIGEITLLASITGKLTAPVEELKKWRDRLEADGLQASAMIFAVGHPQMEKFYEADGAVRQAEWYEGPLGFGEAPAAGGANPMDAARQDLDILPRGWQYAVNEFGQNVYCSACPNAAWREGNLPVIRALAGIFDEVWYDDEYRVDSDQFAGESHRSTASCYCASCLEAVGRRLGRKVTTADVLADQRVHEAWIEHKVECLTSAWNTFVDAGRAVNPKLAVGLMVRWGGEERDGLDVPALVGRMGERLLLRLGEGHFGVDAYGVPANQVVEYLVSSYHVSWYPRAAVVKSETTYFAPMPREWVVKKAALALGAGARQLSYCPCVPEWVEYQKYIAQDAKALAQWGDALGDKGLLWGEIQLLRGKAAATGDRRPAQRRLDRQPMPLFGLAGLCSCVVRVDGWRHDRKAAVVGVCGRAVWDYPPREWAGHKWVVLEGAALLEGSPANEALEIGEVHEESAGRVSFADESRWKPDGRLWRKGQVIILPVVWQNLPEAQLESWLGELRRVIGPLVPSVVVEGDLQVMPIQYRHSDRDVVMLANLTRQARRVRLRLPSGRSQVQDLEGKLLEAEWELKPDAIQVVQLR